ncbi:protein ZBED8-like [Melanaphis sacchari]|uniref:protein ZBED8-like n=1 Tax=Melanaphis sacchari TaxID=742174 RepID=UPI000DC15358|nr:protein ZBED8-like [Melanaphis sacchari]
MKLGTSGARFETSEKVLHTSYEISLLIAKSKKPHTIGETLIKPCLLKATEEILGKEAAKKIQDIPLSNNTVKSRIGNMSQDIEEQLICLIKKSPWFALQCDESTDVAQCCQLLIFVRFLSGDNTIKKELLLSQVLETTSKGVDVMKIILDYFEKHKLMWENLAGFCTDGAPAMLGSRSGLATLVKQKNPTTLTTHCIIHRQALASKTLPKDLAFAMKISIQLVNAIKNSALNTRVFQKLCANMDAEHETLLFHTETRWLSKGNMLARLFELREELKFFLIDKGMNYLYEQLCSGNVKLEGSANIFVKNYSVFPNLRVLIDDEHYKCFTEDIQNNVLEHLRILKEEFTRYFPEYGVVDIDVVKKLIRNPFTVEVNNVQEEMQEELIDFQNDSNLKSSFEFSTNLEEFWCKKAMGYPNIRQTALRFLMVFSTTYLYEQGFSSLLSIQNKQRNRLNPSDDMRLALSNSIVPRISQLVKEARPNKSH